MNKNKKGFTLIELLAVIVILAVIALIAIPEVIDIIAKARKSAFEDSVYGIIRAGEMYYTNELLENGGMSEDKEFIIENGKFKGDKLPISGSLPNSGKVKVTADGDVALVLSDGKYYVQKTTTESEIEVKSLKEDKVKEEELDYKEETGSSEETGKVNIFTTSTKNPSIPACITHNTECEAGTGVAIKVNNTQTYDFYVVTDNTSSGEMELIMSENLGENVAWITKEDYLAAGGTESDWGENGNNNKGPLTVLKALEERTSSWTNIPLKTYTYEDVYEKNYATITRTARASIVESYSSIFGCGVNYGDYDDIPELTRLLYDSERFWVSRTDTGYDFFSNDMVSYACGANQGDYGDLISNKKGVRPVIHVSRNTN